MDSRIVISFRAVGGPGRTFLERARALAARSKVHGAEIVAWDAGRVSFAFPPDRLAGALSLLETRGADHEDGEPAWSVGIAEGDLRRVADDGSLGTLAWGAPLVAASALASAAEPGEVLCAQTMRALRSGELLAAGSRIARDGALKVRGVRLDRHRPWRRQAVEELWRMRVAPLAGTAPPEGTLPSGSLFVLRAEPGMGGTRWLTELAARSAHALHVTPSGSGLEPLGALRRAFARSATRERSEMLRELAPSLERLVGGDGVSIEVAAQLVRAFLSTGDDRAADASSARGLLLLDDAAQLDPATLEACAAAARAEGSATAIVVRSNAAGKVPHALASLPRAGQLLLGPLAAPDAESLAGGCTNDALDLVARRRWAKLGGNVPLGVVEAVAFGIVTGDLRWDGDHATPRGRASGRGKRRDAAEWITLRARDENAACRTLLCLIALLGGEAKVTRLARVLDQAGQAGLVGQVAKAGLALDVELVLEELIRGRWLVDTQEDWVALPSRTHREALASLLEADVRGALHSAAADVLEDEEGALGRAEAAWHATEAGDVTRASRILLAAARATTHARLAGSTTQLVAFARNVDASCEAAALEVLAHTAELSADRPAAALTMSIAPPTIAYTREPDEDDVPPSSLQPFDVSGNTHDSEPPRLTRDDLAPMSAIAGTPIASPALAALDDAEVPASGAAGGTNVAARLGELARDALLSADNALLERWVDGLRATGESPRFAERMGAMARLGRGDIADALRVLRRTRTSLDPEDHALRCQTSLALGVALSVAGRPQEALLEGMDALSRARRANDERGAQACLAFLAKLYASVGRPEQIRR
ncbi:MAG: hypothetical protein JWP97_3584 [Labilithrix sp.]|nr:hypothetical protein [Labilithrix sp.]